MTAGQFFLVYLASLVIFLAVDLIWLGKIARNFYRRQLGGLMLDRLKWLPAVLFYLLYISGLMLLVVVPAVDEASALRAGLFGALLGAVAYATYDLSNLATLKNWPAAVVAADIAWGTILTSAVSLSAFAIAMMLQ